MNAEDRYLEDLIGKGAGDPDFHRPIKYIGEDKAKVQLTRIYNNDFDSWYDRDNDARSPLEADLEDINA